jgi:hypothetical protein
MDFSSRINEATSTVTILNGAEKIVLATADGVKASEAVKFTSTLLDTPALPEFLSFSPFRIRFAADGGAQLIKEGFGAISFGKTNYEDLITIINTAINQCTDKLRIRGGARAGLSAYNPPDPII